VLEDRIHAPKATAGQDCAGASRAQFGRRPRRGFANLSVRISR
jgi:hypothetical protein